MRDQTDTNVDIAIVTTALALSIAFIVLGVIWW